MTSAHIAYITGIVYVAYFAGTICIAYPEKRWVLRCLEYGDHSYMKSGDQDSNQPTN